MAAFPLSSLLYDDECRQTSFVIKSDNKFQIQNACHGPFDVLIRRVEEAFGLASKKFIRKMKCVCSFKEYFEWLWYFSSTIEKFESSKYSSHPQQHCDLSTLRRSTSTHYPRQADPIPSSITVPSPKTAVLTTNDCYFWRGHDCPCSSWGIQSSPVSVRITA